MSFQIPTPPRRVPLPRVAVLAGGHLEWGLEGAPAATAAPGAGQEEMTRGVQTQRRRQIQSKCVIGARVSQSAERDGSYATKGRKFPNTQLKGRSALNESRIRNIC